MSIAIIDSGGANIASLLYAFERLSTPARLTTDKQVIRRADKVILPGVGAAKAAMDRLRENDLIDTIRRLEQPVLGICLGMQLLVDASEEEDVECLGIIPGIAQKLAGGVTCPVPNMGWCATRRVGRPGLLDGIDNGAYFYYVHSYAVPVSEHTLATAEHSTTFSAMIGKGNFTAAQFHPERSAAAGSRLLSNFLGLNA